MLGLVIGGLIFGGAAIGHAIKNADMKSSPYRYTDDGKPVYLDYECNEWINGEKVIPTYDYKNQKLVYAGAKTGTVYFDPQQAKAERMRKTFDEPNLKKSIERGELVYNRWYPEYEKVLTTEISTGKIIIKIGWDWKTGMCKKYYYTGGYKKLHSTACFICPQENNKGVIISKEEYDKLYDFLGAKYLIGPL